MRRIFFSFCPTTIWARLVRFFPYFLVKSPCGNLGNFTSNPIIEIKMGAAASINHTATPERRSSISTTFNTFPIDGVKFSQFQRFLDECCGEDRRALEGLTTADVCEKFVKPATSTLLCSFCDLLRKQGHPAVGHANVFIIHAWGNDFLDTLRALQYHFRDDIDNVVIWLDIFSISQHAPMTMDTHWFQNTCKTAVQSFDRTV